MPDVALGTWLSAGSFVLSLAVMPLLIKLAHSLQFVDKPAHRKVHLNSTPLLGGAGIFAGGGIALAAYVLMYAHASHAVLVKLALIGGAGAGGLFLGLVDDRYELRARYKFYGQFLIATAFVAVGFQFNILRFPGFAPFSLHFLNLPFTVLWILAVVNGLNMIDGADGLAGTSAFVIAAGTGILASCIDDTAVAMLSFAAAGAVLGFLVFNWSPARIYMGDAGTMGLGLLLATSLVSLGGQRKFFWHAPKSSEEIFNYFVPMVTAIVIYPFLEVSLSTTRRWLRGKPIAGADRGHIHHRLLNRNWTPAHISAVAGTLCLLGSGVAISVVLRHHGVASWLLCVLGAIFGYGIHLCGFIKHFHPVTIQEDRPHFLIANHFVAMQSIKLNLAESHAQVVALVTQTCIEFGVQSFRVKALAPACAYVPGTSVTRDVGEFVSVWQRPPDVQSKFLPEIIAHHRELQYSFSDKTEIAGVGAAEWTFEPHLIEEEIDVEYRVLVSQFMREALSRAAAIPVREVSRDLPAQNVEISSHNLRHRSLRALARTAIAKDEASGEIK